jgi:hypothetical protein
MPILNGKAKKYTSLIQRMMMGIALASLMGGLSVVWAEDYRSRPYDYRYERGRHYDPRWHDREWYERHRHAYRYYPPPPVYAPPPVIYAPPPPPPGISIILPPIIIR